MTRHFTAAGVLSALMVTFVPCAPASAQPDFGPGGPGGGRGGMGPGGPERKLLKKFDTNADGVLDKAERDAAREAIKADPEFRPRGPRGPGGAGGPGGPGGPGGGRGGRTEPTSPGPALTPADVPTYADVPLYDTGVVRTIFLEFETPDWESELADFYNSDVEVPARMHVDGKDYSSVGVHFRGASSYFMVPAGSKRSLNLTMDLVDKDQTLQGFRTLNLLNCNGDATFMSSVLYSRLAREHIAAPRAAYARVVVNGESWGLYALVEQFNKDFVAEHFGSGEGARWKAPGSPNGASGLDYLGDDIEAYKRRYEIKSKDREKDWEDLAHLCRVLSETPLEELEAALEPILDIEGALWFLALDNALSNSDGYWVRASDYSFYKDPSGKFHLIPHDMNEAWNMAGRPGGPGAPFGGPPGGPPDGPGGFGPARGPDGEQPEPEVRPARQPGGEDARGNEPAGERPEGGRRRGGRGGMGHGGPELDPLIGMDDARKPLRSRLLQVPSLRERYLRHMRTLAEELEWARLGPEVARLRALIRPHVEADTRKLTSLAAFDAATGEGEEGAGARSLRTFAQKRSEYLLAHPEIKKIEGTEGDR